MTVVSILSLSLLIRVLTVAVAVILTRRLHNWFMGFFALMVALMSVRQALTLASVLRSMPAVVIQTVDEVPGLLVSVFAFLAVFTLNRYLLEGRKRQELLAKSEEHFRLFVEHALDVVYRLRVHPTFQLEYVSPSLSTISGYDLTEFERDPGLAFRLIHPDDWPQVEAYIEAPETFLEPPLLRIIRKDGDIRWLECRNALSRDESGQLIAVDGIARDVSARKEAEERLRKSEERYRGLFDLAADGIFLSDADGNFLNVNTSGCQMLGYEQEELLQLNFRDVILPESLAAKPIQFEQLRAGHTLLIERDLRRKDGSILPVEVSSKMLPDGTIQGIARDIRERKQAEAALHQQNRMTEQLLSTTLDGFILADTQGTILDVNPAYCRMIGYTQSELLGMNIQQLEGALSPAEIGEKIAQMVAHGSALFETRHRRKDGQLIDLDVSITIVQSDDGPLVAAFVRDITEQNRAAERMRLYAERLAALREIDQCILAARSLDELFHKVLERVYRLVPTRRISVALFDPTASYLTVGAVIIDGEFRDETGQKLRISEDVFSNLSGGRPRVVEDIAALASPAPLELLRLRQGIRSYINIPLLVRGEIVGSLNLGADSPGYFDTEMVETAQEIAAPLAVGLQQARLNDELRRRVQDLLVVHQASLQLQQLLPPHELAQEIIRVLDKILGCKFAAVLLIDEETGQLVPFAIHNRDNEVLAADKAFLAAHELRVGDGVTGWVAQTGQSVRLGDVSQDPRYYPLHEDIKSEICVPLRLRDRIVGVVNLESVEPEAYSEWDQHVLETIAAQIAVSIENSRLFETVQQSQLQLREMGRRLNEIAEVERKQLAQELHDRVGQTLTALSINLNVARSLLPPEGSDQAGLRLDDSVHLLEEAAESIRDVMAELRPAVLDDYGLAAALRWYVETVSRRTSMTIHYKDEGCCERLKDAVETNLFRIAQEALHNVLKHARATEATVKLDCDEHKISLSVSDNGVGFDPENQMAAGKNRDFRGSWGLTIMNERARGSGGRLWIDSTPGAGTRITVDVPLAQAVHQR